MKPPLCPSVLVCLCALLLPVWLATAARLTPSMSPMASPMTSIPLPAEEDFRVAAEPQMEVSSLLDAQNGTLVTHCLLPPTPPHSLGPQPLLCMHATLLCGREVEGGVGSTGSAPKRW